LPKNFYGCAKLDQNEVWIEFRFETRHGCGTEHDGGNRTRSKQPAIGSFMRNDRERAKCRRHSQRHENNGRAVPKCVSAWRFVAFRSGYQKRGERHQCQELKNGKLSFPSTHKYQTQLVKRPIGNPQQAKQNRLRHRITAHHDHVSNDCRIPHDGHPPNVPHADDDDQYDPKPGVSKG